MVFFIVGELVGVFLVELVQVILIIGFLSETKSLLG